MANMSYCRFQNTLQDLKDCASNMGEDDLSFDEFRARYRLIKLCAEVSDGWLHETQEPLPSREKYESH